jgi:hypothetical protein
MSTLSLPLPQVNPETGLLRGQAATISRIHRVSITAVIKAAKSGRGRPTLLKTIEEYRARNIAAQQPTPASA